MPPRRRRTQIRTLSQPGTTLKSAPAGTITPAGRCPQSPVDNFAQPRDSVAGLCEIARAREVRPKRRLLSRRKLCSYSERRQPSGARAGRSRRSFAAFVLSALALLGKAVRTAPRRRATGAPLKPWAGDHCAIRHRRTYDFGGVHARLATQFEKANSAAGVARSLPLCATRTVGSPAYLAHQRIPSMPICSQRIAVRRQSGSASAAVLPGGLSDGTSN